MADLVLEKRIDEEPVMEDRTGVGLGMPEAEAKPSEADGAAAAPKEGGDLKTSFLSEREQAMEKPHDVLAPEELYEELKGRILRYHPSADLTMIEKAYKLASEAHKDQKRKSGEPYIIHPICVAIILADLELDKETIAAGLLHDVVEDTEYTNEDIRREFGDEVELLVDGVTKLGQIDYSTDKIEVQAENLRKMFLAMAKDIRVILIKLADRLHNMRTLQYMRPEKQIEKSRETMEIFSPIAQRLGISRVKTEMDDLALKYLKPEVYESLVKQVDARKTQRQDFVDGIVHEVREKVGEAGIEAEVRGRVKHFFSIYKKMVNQDKTIDQIYDLFAVRIIVDSLQDCYASLGIIHDMYKPVPGRFKDYIAMPKPNMYQSLHTTVIGPDGTPFEIQIRTWEMHRTAEYGIAAHWKYKEKQYGHAVTGNEEEEKLAWLREILEWQQDLSDNHEFLSLLKSDLDLFAENVYCFTPAGDVKSLPAGSCAIDFAYSIHSAVGNRMVGARINGKMVPIETELKNGDRIEIITSQNSRGPSLDWLKVVKSTQAKNKINQWFRKQLKPDNIEHGRDLVGAQIRARGYTAPDLMKPEYMEAVMKKYGFRDWDSVLAAVGHGGLKEGQVVNKMIDLYEDDRRKKVTDEEILAAKSSSAKLPIANIDGKGSIMVQGMQDLAVHFAKCCSPIPGDEIVGYVTRGRGITIHRTDCVNVIHMSVEDRARLQEAEWVTHGVEKSTTSYMVELVIYAENRTGLLLDISRIFSERKIDIGSVSNRVSKQGVATLEFGFRVKSRDELETLVREVRKIKNIIEIRRKSG